jgi:hypothetical protein
MPREAAPSRHRNDRNDRMVQVALSDGSELVRYAVAGHWYLERPDGTRDRVTTGAAVAVVMDDPAAHLSKALNAQFAAKLQRAREWSTCAHAERCCARHGVHVTPHRGCILR